MLHFFATSVFPKNHCWVCHPSQEPCLTWHVPQNDGSQDGAIQFEELCSWLCDTPCFSKCPLGGCVMCFPHGFGGENTPKRLRWWFEVQFFHFRWVCVQHDSSNCIIVHIWVGLVGDGSDFSPRGSFFFKLSGFPKVSKGQVTWKVEEMDSTKLELWPIETPEESPKWFPRNEMMSFSSHSP